MLTYSNTLSSAKEFAEAGKIVSWITIYLRNEGNNTSLLNYIQNSCGYIAGPLLLPLNSFFRCTGPEESMKYLYSQEKFSQHVDNLRTAIKENGDLPPIIAKYKNRKFEINDGNHRHKAYEIDGCKTIWSIVWVENETEMNELIKQQKGVINPNMFYKWNCILTKNLQYAKGNINNEQ